MKGGGRYRLEISLKVFPFAFDFESSLLPQRVNEAEDKDENKNRVEKMGR